MMDLGSRKWFVQLGVKRDADEAVKLCISGL